MTEYIKCGICNNKISKKSLHYHVKRYHNLTLRNYKIQMGEIAQKMCLNCDADITKLKAAAKFCNSDCKLEYKIKQTHLKHTDEYLYVECKECGLRGGDLTKHIYNVHEMEIKEYRAKYGCGAEGVRSQQYLDRLSLCYSSKNNPGYQHEGKLSPFSKKFVAYDGLSEDEKNKKIAEIGRKAQEVAKQNGNMATTLEYYIKRGYTEEEASRALVERQTTFSKEKCLEKYGEVKGLEIWKERQRKWQRTLISKSDEEKELIKRKKATSLNYRTFLKSDRLCKMYLLEISNDREKFLKIGLTTRSIAKRFNETTFKNTDYRYKIIECINGLACDLSKIEIELKRYYKNLRITPEQKFAGWTECFEMGACDILKMEIKKYE